MSDEPVKPLRSHANAQRFDFVPLRLTKIKRIVYLGDIA